MNAFESTDLFKTAAAHMELSKVRRSANEVTLSVIFFLIATLMGLLFDASVFTDIGSTPGKLFAPGTLAISLILFAKFIEIRHYNATMETAVATLISLDLVKSIQTPEDGKAIRAWTASNGANATVIALLLGILFALSVLSSFRALTVLHLMSGLVFGLALITLICSAAGDIKLVAQTLSCWMIKQMETSPSPSSQKPTVKRFLDLLTSENGLHMLARLRDAGLFQATGQSDIEVIKRAIRTCIDLAIPDEVNYAAIEILETFRLNRPAAAGNTASPRTVGMTSEAS